MQRKATLTFCRAAYEAGYLLTLHDDSSKRTVNEVVRTTDKDGKWVEVEYYLWLCEEYRNR